jgi:predicted metal-dependent phosphotriesterase family hydrolase
MSDYERQIFEAAAKASVATGAPITTHTDQGTVGDEQQRLLTSLGVPAHRIVIGHSCGTSNHDYHLGIARGGSYLGFDRFGLDMLRPDAERTRSLLRLIQKGVGDRVVVFTRLGLVLARDADPARDHARRRGRGQVAPAPLPARRGAGALAGRGERSAGAGAARRQPAPLLRGREAAGAGVAQAP